MQLEGKIALITSGSTGIGYGIAEAFLREGAKVAINGRNEEKGQEALTKLGSPENTLFVKGDVLVREDVDHLIEATVEKFGRLDILVNNAGGLLETAPVADLSDEAWDHAIKWNLYSTFWASRAALKHMIAQEFGRIINISSVEGKNGKPAIPGYVTSKHAMNGLTKAIARENGEKGITCNAICPGLVMTEILKSSGPATAEKMGITFDELIGQFADETAIKRISTVEEVAGVAVLLASDIGAGLTGSMYNVDGGTSNY